VNTAPSSIEAYVASVRQAFRGARAERFLAEVNDHLLEATAEGLERGLAPEAAEARAINLFGPPELVVDAYAAELADALWEKHMRTLRFIAVPVALLSLYYARFFLAVRQEASTLVQIGILLAATAVLAIPVRLTPIGAGWFRNGRPASVPGWATIVVAVGLAVAFFAWADHDAHSASDTLNRAVPTLCLIVAIVLRIAYADPTYNSGDMRNRAPSEL
jgi:hypothetical protein